MKWQNKLKRGTHDNISNIKKAFEIKNYFEKRSWKGAL